MQRNSVISLRASPRTWQRAAGAAGADPQAAYGCVDWYLYQEEVACTVAAAQRDPPASLIERAVAVRAPVSSETAASLRNAG